MRADVADAAGGATLRGVGAPRRLLLAAVLKLRRQPVLRILHLHHAQRAELAGRDHLARLPHQRMAGVVVREAEDEPARAHHLLQRQRVVERAGQRLVADHVDARLRGMRGRGHSAGGSA